MVLRVRCTGSGADTGSGAAADGSARACSVPNAPLPHYPRYSLGAWVCVGAGGDGTLWGTEAQPWQKLQAVFRDGQPERVEEKGSLCAARSRHGVEA